jgi:hypothetical protein
VGDAHVEPTRLSLSDEQCFDAALRVMLARISHRE